MVIAVIWDALKAACESDLQTAQLIVNSAGIIVTVPDLSTCFDERGRPMILLSLIVFEAFAEAPLPRFSMLMSAQIAYCSAEVCIFNTQHDL